MDIYQTLCVVRTALVNSIGEMTMTGKVVNYSTLLSDVGDELELDRDLVNELEGLTSNLLLDLGFNYINDDSDLMLFPLWLYPLIPDGAELYAIDHSTFIVGDDTFEIYADNWINAGIFPFYDD